MKSLIVITLLVIGSAIGSIAYVDAQINANVREFKEYRLQETATNLQPAKSPMPQTKNPQKTINGAQLHLVSINVEATPNEILQTKVNTLEVR